MRQLKSSGGMTHGRGITESTLTKWVHALPRCVPICNALERYTSVHSGTSEQHKDLRPASELKDNTDLSRFTQWLEAHPPFVQDLGLLVNIATGIVADSSVNCDNAVQIGQSAMIKMTGKTYVNITLHRKEKVKPFSAMKNTINVRGEKVVVNPSILFNRITCILSTSSELDTFLQYELALQPPSLFLDGQLRKTTKSVLGTMIKSLVSSLNTIPDYSKFVLDGGHLLYSVIWPQPANYQEVCASYKSYILNRYKVGATVVFDGYDCPLSTKSAEQNRRAKSRTSASIMVSPDLPTTTTQNRFLGNRSNKTRLIQVLTAILEYAGIHVRQAKSDADTLIVHTALEIASTTNSPVVVIGTDTDLLAILVARATPSMNLYMLCQDKPTTLFNVKEIQDTLGEIKQYILFIHAFTGCDTTSAIYNKGKSKALNLARTNRDLYLHMNMFVQDSSSHDDIAHAGEMFFLALYDAQKFSTLNKYRPIAYKRGVAKTSLSGRFQLASIPPTSAAARQHCYRVYLQIQEWMGHNMPPTEWGWQVIDQTLIPIATDQPPAPRKLINFISCACIKGCGKACGCRKVGMVCSEMCINCMGISCCNEPEPEVDVDIQGAT